MTKKEFKEDAQKSALKWRLGNKPTREDVMILLEKEIISKDEARQMLFSEETKDDKLKALEEQIEFLKNVIEKMSNQSPQIVYKYVTDYVPRITYVNSGIGNWEKTKFFAGNIASNMIASTAGNNATFGSSIGGLNSPNITSIV